jgi:hypothetical protein
VRFSLVRWEPDAWETGVERPGIEIFDAAAAVEVVESSPLREYYGEPARVVLRAAIPPRERLVVTVSQSGKAAQVLAVNFA